MMHALSHDRGDANRTRVQCVAGLVVATLVGLAAIGGFLYTFVPRIALADVLPDPRLRTCLATQLKSDPEGSVSPAQLNSVRWLTCGDPDEIFSKHAYADLTLERDSVDLTGIENLPSLTGLDLSNTEIADFHPLTFLPRIRFLSLANVPTVDWDVIGKLTTLQWLDLHMPFRSERAGYDLTELHGLSNLTWLDASSSGLISLRGLEGTPSLEHLDVSFNPIDDLTPIEGLVELQYLYLTETSVTDLRPLHDLKHLTLLTLRQTPVFDLAPLKNSHELKALDVRETSVTDISPITDDCVLEWDGE